MDEPILVTGAAGFIGSHLVDRLLADGRTVVGVDCFTDYYPRAVKERNLAGARGSDAFTLVEADLRTADLRPILDGVDAVVHEAAMGGLVRSWSSFESYLSCNVLGTQRLVEAIRDVGVPHLVHASTSSVYGRASSGDEDRVPAPDSPYGVTKLAAEHLIQAYRRNFDLPMTILRYFSIYGPRQRPDMGYHIFIDRILRGETITVYGTGFGPYSQKIIDGFTFPDPSDYLVVDPVEVNAGGVSIRPEWSGGAPGFAGMTATRFRVPDSASAAVDLAVRVNGKTSNSVVLPVQ